jgi:hypothetical protein
MCTNKLPFIPSKSHIDKSPKQLPVQYQIDQDGGGFGFRRSDIICTASVEKTYERPLQMVVIATTHLE